jgi:hypothetical protein
MYPKTPRGRLLRPQVATGAATLLPAYREEGPSGAQSLSMSGEILPEELARRTAAALGLAASGKDRLPVQNSAHSCAREPIKD